MKKKTNKKKSWAHCVWKVSEYLAKETQRHWIISILKLAFCCQILRTHTYSLAMLF